jgi:hypothetical protein
VLPDEREYFPAMQVLVVLPVKVHWIGDAEPGDDESKLKTFLRACADIERAVGAEVQAGGFVGCNDARLVGRTYDTIGGSQMWAMVDVRFRFTRTFGTPESM